MKPAEFFTLRLAEPGKHPIPDRRIPAHGGDTMQLGKSPQKPSIQLEVACACGKQLVQQTVGATFRKVLPDVGAVARET